MAVPNHIAIILDGNGRWAKSQGLPRTHGHIEGAKNVEHIAEAAYELGVKYLTLYAFSTENWNRPQDEVAALMKLLSNYLKNCLKTAQKNNMRVRVIGDLSKLESTMQNKIMELMEFSKDFDGLQLTIAINYGSRDEIIRGIKKCYNQIQKGEFSIDELTVDNFNRFLDTKDMPDPDLMIRTSGEQRLSNYLLWQLAYGEFYFTDVPWPQFHKEQLQEAIEAYENRDRRYGKVK